MVWVAALGSTAGAEEPVDAVFLMEERGQAAPTVLGGTILDWTAQELRLRNRSGVEVRLPTDRVWQVQTPWPASFLAGRTSRRAGRLEEAGTVFAQAYREETRPWARREIAAEWCSTALEAGRIVQAIDHFLVLADGEVAARHLEVIPLPWRAVALDEAAQQQAEAWRTSPDRPYARLLGASWLLPTRRAPAVATLEGLAGGPPPVSHLATIQLWRSRLAAATSADAVAWQQALVQFPPAVQAAGWYILGDLWARHQQPAAAALAYLHVPLRFRRQRAMAADALLAAAQQLEKMQPPDQAWELYRELMQEFGHLPAGQVARRRWSEREGARP